MTAAIRLFEPQDAPVTVTDVITAYLDHRQRLVEQAGLSKDAFKDTQRDLQRFAASHQHHADECEQSELLTWLDANQQWKSGHKRQRVVRDIVACFRWASESKLIDHNPYRSIADLSKAACSTRRPATHAEYVTLMRHGSRPLRRALFFLRRTGARTCEMRETRWEDLHLDGDRPHVCLYRHKTHRMTGKPRKIGLDAGTVRFLRNLKRHSAGIGHVFRNCDNGPWTRGVFARHLRRTAERLGLDDGVDERVSGYCLRHTYACDAVKAGFSLNQIADQLGNTAAIVQKVYASHTRQDPAYLSGLANGITAKRKRNLPKE